MTEVKNFEKAGEFFNYNHDFIYDNYLPHYNLIKTIERLRDKSLELIDAFNIVGDDCYILSICTTSGWIILSDTWSDHGINLLFGRLNIKRFQNWTFGGQRKLLIDLFTRYSLNYVIEKDRLIYECKSATPLGNVSKGMAVTSTIDDWQRLTELTHAYSLEEWGEREGRGIDYVQNLVLGSIQNKTQVQWEDENVICSIAQVMNLENNFPMIGSLYTDKSMRNQGYATSLLYKVTDQLLKQGYESVGLLSDVTNPTTNKIFKLLGYQAVYEFILIFKP